MLGAVKKGLVNGVVFVVKFYQKIFSFDHGLFSFIKPFGSCRFYPSCSQYSIIALQKYGLLKGVKLSFMRVLRCNPWTEGGVDEP